LGGELKVDDDTLKKELYYRTSTPERAVNSLWEISGSIESLKEKLNPGPKAEQDFQRCLKAIGDLAERLGSGGVAE
jgi:hypothetical protein